MAALPLAVAGRAAALLACSRADLAHAHCQLVTWSINVPPAGSCTRIKFSSSTQRADRAPRVGQLSALPGSRGGIGIRQALHLLSQRAACPQDSGSKVCCRRQRILHSAVSVHRPLHSWGLVLMCHMPSALSGRCAGPRGHYCGTDAICHAGTMFSHSSLAISH